MDLFPDGLNSSLLILVTVLGESVFYIVMTFILNNELNSLIELGGLR